MFDESNSWRFVGDTTVRKQVGTTRRHRKAQARVHTYSYIFVQRKSLCGKLPGWDDDVGGIQADEIEIETKAPRLFF